MLFWKVTAHDGRCEHRPFWRNEDETVTKRKRDAWCESALRHCFLTRCLWRKNLTKGFGWEGVGGVVWSFDWSFFWFVGPRWLRSFTRWSKVVIPGYNPKVMHRQNIPVCRFTKLIFLWNMWISSSFLSFQAPVSCKLTERHQSHYRHVILTLWRRNYFFKF